MAAASCSDTLPSRALVIHAKWLEPIFSGKKIWEVRGQSLKLRGRVSLACEGQLVGEIEFTDALRVGERDAGNTLVAVRGHEQHFIALPKNKEKTCVEDLAAIPYTRLYAWVMTNPRRYSHPICYRHPQGAQKFVDLTRPGVVPAATPAAGASGSRTHSAEEAARPSTSTTRCRKKVPEPDSTCKASKRKRIG